MCNEAEAEQVTEVRGAEAVQNHWQQGVWEDMPPELKASQVLWCPNLTRLEFFSHSTIIMGKKDKIGLFAQNFRE